ncbi:porin [Thioalkalivibrio sp. ALJ24]|uniref:porin n=1 Tax=Thioalkalivibrio sp. ALJ24 TaxID=545276 RepID=UPI0003719EEB|nr:porin [Thioalkalivibrio sp. ALJ24]
MKKKILAVAVAGAFAVPAFAHADSSVTLSGTLQTQVVGYGSWGDADSNVEMADAGGIVARGDGAGPNRITFDVNHDLGGGLSAIARYNTDLNVSSAGGLSDRDTYVGLSGDFGTVTVGRQATPFNTAGRDPLNATFLQARMNAGRTGPLGGLGNGGFLDDAIAYSNDWGMVNFAGALVLDPADDSDTALSARVGFNVMDGLEIYGAYTHADDHSFVANQLDGNAGEFVDLIRGWADIIGVSGALDDLDGDGTSIEDALLVGAGDARLGKIGADWSQGPFRVVGEVEHVDIETAAGNTVADYEAYFLSGSYTMGQLDFVLNLGHTDNTGGSNGRDYVGFATKYNFSNNVMAYAGVGYLDDRGFNDGEGEDTTSVGAGMRVSF